MAKGGGGKGHQPGKFATSNAAKVSSNKELLNLGEAVAAVHNPANNGKGQGKMAKASKSPVKGSSKGSSANKPPIDGSWLCRRLQCPWAESGKYNLPFRNSCGSCCRPKGEAMNPPAYARAELKRTSPSVSTRPKQEPNGKGTPPQAKQSELTTAEADEEEAPKVDHPVDSRAIIAAAIGISLACKQMETEGIYRKPSEREAKEKELVQAAAVKTLAADHLAKLRVEVLECEDVTALTSKIGLDSAVHKEAVKVLETKQQELLKAEEKTPESAHELERIRLVRQQVVAARAEAKRKAAVGQEKARARHDKHLEVLDSEIQALQERRAELIESYDDAAEMWLQHHTELDKEHSFKLEAYDTRIKTLLETLEQQQLQQQQQQQQQQRQQHSAQPNSTTTTAATAATTTATTATAASSAISQSDAAITALQNQQQQLQVQLKQAKAYRKKQQDYIDAFERRVPGILLKELPDVKPEADGLAQQCAHLLCLLERWELEGCQPFSYQQLQDHASTGPRTADVIKSLLGPLWAKFYPNEGPQVGEIAPRQLVTCLIKALQKAAKYITDEIANVLPQKADEALEAFVVADKKRRIDWDSEIMQD